VAETPVEILERWEDAGAFWRPMHVSDEWAIIEMCTCTGEPVDRLESGDPELIKLAREREETT
jgi:hypothetical protein